MCGYSGRRAPPGEAAVLPSWISHDRDHASACRQTPRGAAPSPRLSSAVRSHSAQNLGDHARGDVERTTRGPPRFFGVHPSFDRQRFRVSRSRSRSEPHRYAVSRGAWPCGHAGLTQYAPPRCVLHDREPSQSSLSDMGARRPRRSSPARRHARTGSTQPRTDSAARSCRSDLADRAVHRVRASTQFLGLPRSRSAARALPFSMPEASPQSVQHSRP